LSAINILPISTTYVGYLNINYFYANTYEGNFFTAGSSLIHLEGSPRTYFTDEYFHDNGDMSKEAINVYGTFGGWTILTAAANEMTISAALTSPDSYASTTLGQALITIKRGVQVSYTRTWFNRNWKIENPLNDYGTRA
jgi:hypothetical protein